MSNINNFQSISRRDPPSSYNSRSNAREVLNSSSNLEKLTADNCYKSLIINGKAVIVCKANKCDYKSDKNSNFKRHFETMHTLLEPPVECCNLRFRTKGEFRHHSKSIHREGHRCQLCGKLFNRKALLERHMSIHTGSKPFRCPVCDYASANKANVVRHLSTHKSCEVKDSFDAQSSFSTSSESISPSLTPPSTEESPVSIVSAPAEIIPNFPKRKSISHSIESILSQPYSSPRHNIFTANSISSPNLKITNFDMAGVKNLFQVNESGSSFKANWSHTSSPFMSHNHFQETNPFPPPYGFVHYHQSSALAVVPVSYTNSSASNKTSMVYPKVETGQNEQEYCNNMTFPRNYLKSTWSNDKSQLEHGLGISNNKKDVLNQNEQGQGNRMFIKPEMNQDSRLVPDFSSCQSTKEVYDIKLEEAEQIHFDDRFSGIQKGALPTIVKGNEENVEKSESLNRLRNKRVRKEEDFMNESPPVPFMNGLKALGGVDVELSTLNVESFHVKDEESNGYVPKKLRLSRKYSPS